MKFNPFLFYFNSSLKLSTVLALMFSLIAGVKIKFESYNPAISSPLDSYTCTRTWLTNTEAKALKSRSKIVNIRNITYGRFRELYKLCKDNGSNKCFYISRSPFFLHWSFPSVLTCLSESNSTKTVILHLHIAFEAILNKIMTPNQPIFKTISNLGPAEKVNENRFIIQLNSNLIKNPNISLRAAKLRMRDFHHIFPSYTAVAKMSMELIASRNFTVIFPRDNNPYDKERLVPGLFPRLFSNSIQTHSLNRSLYYEGALDGQTETANYNFVYCDNPRKSHASIWDFSPLTSPFQTFVWFLLISATIVLSSILFVKLQVEQYFLLKLHSSPPVNFETFSSITWSLISVLISVPGFFGLKFSLKKSHAFVSWLFAALILTNFYTALLTSRLIQPVPDKTLKDLKGLVENGYTFVFGDGSPNVFQSVLEAVRLNKLVRSMTANYSFPSTDFDLMEILLTNTPEKRIFPDLQFIEKAAFEPKEAIFGSWLYSFWIYQRTTQLIESKSNDHGINPRICHFGKKMVTGPPLFWGFYPPNVEWLYETYLGFSQSGIEDLWLREFNGLNFARRVQDRSKVLGKTELAPDQETTKPTPIQLDDGHFLTVVTLGVVCILLSVTVLVLEIFYHRLISTKVKRINVMATCKRTNEAKVYSFII